MLSVEVAQKVERERYFVRFCQHHRAKDFSGYNSRSTQNCSSCEKAMMASGPENVKNNLDNAANSQPPPYLLHPPYPPPPSSQPQWLLPAYPSAPPPEYGQVVGSKTYEGSNAIGPYQYTTSEANQPQQMLLPTNVQSRNIPPSPPQQQVVFVERNALRIDRHQSQQSFMTHIILSCCVFWCCGWMCGGIAFIVALIAQSSAASGDVAGARRLGHLSLGLSICGLITGIIVTIVVIVGAAH